MTAKSDKEVPVKEEPKEEEIEEEEEEEETEDENKEVVEETAEEKAAKEAQEKEEADKVAKKAARKEDRTQRRINELTAAKKNLETELANVKLQLAADPDKKLTEEEVQSRAEAIAAKKLADKELKDIQSNFEAACAKLQKDGQKIDKDFDAKVNDMAETFGQIPSFMIGVLEDFDNGGEVLAFLANDEDEAEKIYEAKNKPAKMTKLLVEISNKLEQAKKPVPKPISKVPETVKPVGGNRASNSNIITEADTKNMDSYVAKRRAQQEERRKTRGY